MPQVVCIGILVADVVGRPIDRIPDKGKLVLVDNMELHTGGCATNTGTALARLGFDTAVIGKVGADGFGDFILKRMTENGLNVEGVVIDPSTNTSATMVMVSSDGERSFLHYTGTNAKFTFDDINWDIVKSAKLLHIGGFFLLPSFDGIQTRDALKRAKELGVITSLDTAWDDRGNWMKLLKPCLPYVDVFLPSIEEAKMLTGESDPARIASKFMEYGVKTVGLKMGSEGSFVKSGDQEFRIPAYKVKVVDATGAGDAFVAGFIAGVVKGWDLETTGRFANAVGASCVTAIGASSGIKSLQETLEFIKTASLA
ncbi:MAG: sugar kinase [Firmicutes bacterium]|nr:sugar kinase [Bacillota bacterium]